MFRRRLARIAGAIALVGCAACQRPSADASAAGAGSEKTVVASIRAEPRSFNRYTTRDLTSVVIGYLSHAALVRINRQTDELEPELAETWELLPDGLTYRLKLRHRVLFSDGHPFSSDDVVFSFAAIYDPDAGGLLADTLLVRGQPLIVNAEGADAVTVRFPSSFSPGLRILDGIPIYPRHRLKAALEAGRFASAWGLSTPLSELAGLGPFVLQRYEPGQRLVFDRNPRYWRHDAGGHALPAVDHVVLEIIPDQDTEQLRIASGDVDFTQSELRPSDYVPMKRAEAEGRVKLTDLGEGRDGDLLWFNLTPSLKNDPRAAWLQSADFRRAVSQAVDRELFVNTVYLGAAVPGYGIVSPGNHGWYTDVSAPGYDVAAAAARLAGLGLADRHGDGKLTDAKGAPVRFSLLTQKGNTSLERGAEVIRENLGRLGIQVDVVELEVGALIHQFSKGEYDAVYFRLLTTDTDPVLNLDFWLSSGSAHVWHPSQTSPATPWEQEIDRLMNEITTITDQNRRHRLFADVQRIMAREEPAICFAFPKLWFAINTRIEQATPAPFRPPVMWNPAVFSLRTQG
jgi:peptide/nickel transport system substrate-binding protein